MNTAANAIVLVDDEMTYTELIAGPLAEAFRCPVHAFTRPQDALAAIPAINPSVIVTDYFMPDLDGIRFIRKATSLVPGARFLMMSGQDLTAQQDQLARLPALKGFLPKPFGWRKLAEEIARISDGGLRIADRGETGNRKPDTGK